MTYTMTCIGCESCIKSTSKVHYNCKCGLSFFKRYDGKENAHIIHCANVTYKNYTLIYYFNNLNKLYFWNWQLGTLLKTIDVDDNYNINNKTLTKHMMSLIKSQILL